MGKRRFGRIRLLSSGRYQARYLGPDGIDRAAPKTFERKADADRWLGKIERELMHGDWTDPDAGRVRLDEFAVRWVVERSGLRPKTRQLYEGLVRLHIVPALGGLHLVDVTSARVRTWRAVLLEGGLGESTVSKAYRLLRTIMATAVEDRLIRVNPCQIKGAAVERSPERPMLTVPQVFAVADGMPERWRCLPLLGTFCSMRWGELAALVRQDVVIEFGEGGQPTDGFVNVRNALVELVDGSMVVGAPKTAAGRRVIAIPASILPGVHEHLQRFVGAAETSPVFTGPKGGLLRRSNFQSQWRAALEHAGVEGVHFHDLRHTGNTLTVVRRVASDATWGSIRRVA